MKNRMTVRQALDSLSYADKERVLGNILYDAFGVNNGEDTLDFNKKAGKIDVDGLKNEFVFYLDENNGAGYDD